MHVKQDGRVRHSSPLGDWQQGEEKQSGHCFLLFHYFQRSPEAGDNFPVPATCICFPPFSIHLSVLTKDPSASSKETNPAFWEEGTLTFIILRVFLS